MAKEKTTPIAKTTVKEIRFPNGNQARLIAPPAGAAPTDILKALEVEQPQALIVVVGGAGSLDKALASKKRLASRLTQLFSRGLARAAVEAGAAIVDGGTHSGVMKLMGQGIADRERKAPLIGVAPAGKVTYPGRPEEDGVAADTSLDPNHSHFVLAPTDEWGGETDLLFDLAEELGKEIPVVTVLGGSHLEGIALDEVLHSVRQGWPVIVLEGSGKLPDMIAGLWRKKNRRRRRSPLTGDPVMTEIIEEGNILIFSPKEPVAELAQLITEQLRILRHDPTLRDAWQRFAEYDQNAIAAQRRFLVLQRAILELGVASTVLALIYFMTKDLETPASIVQVNAVLHILVIATPILVSVLLAVSVKFQKGHSWVLLRNAAEAIKKEIYRYRAQAAIYGDDDEPREAELARKVDTISERLMKTLVNQTGIKPYRGKLPPKYGAARGDDGFSNLTPDKYLSWRLEDQLNWYKGKAVKFSRQAQVLYWLIYILGGVGTLLAAVGREIWIAVTTAVIGALTSYLELKQTEETLRTYNRAATDLDSILMWWHAVPDEERERHNFDKLVKSTEDVIQSEQAGWVQEMQHALAELYEKQVEPEDTEKEPAPAEQPPADA